jgi:hypothetical protein
MHILNIYADKLLFIYSDNAFKQYLANVDVRIDKVDLQILEILTVNCRISYRGTIYS